MAFLSNLLNTDAIRQAGIAIKNQQVADAAKAQKTVKPEKTPRRGILGTVADQIGAGGAGTGFFGRAIKNLTDSGALSNAATSAATPASAPATVPAQSVVETPAASVVSQTPAAVNASPLAMLAAQSLTPATAANAATAAPQRAAGVELPSYAALPALNLPSSSLLGAVGATPSWQYQLPVGVPPGLQLRSGAGGEFTPAQLQLIMLGQPRAPQLSPLQQYAGEQ